MKLRKSKKMMSKLRKSKRLRGGQFIREGGPNLRDYVDLYVDAPGVRKEFFMKLQLKAKRDAKLYKAMDPQFVNASIEAKRDSPEHKVGNFYVHYFNEQAEKDTTWGQW